MEIWDAYYEDGSLAGCDLIRGEKIPDGLYHLVSEVIVRHNDGDFLGRDHFLSVDGAGGVYQVC